MHECLRRRGWIERKQLLSPSPSSSSSSFLWVSHPQDKEDALALSGRNLINHVEGISTITSRKGLLSIASSFLAAGSSFSPFLRQPLGCLMPPAADLDRFLELPAERFAGPYVIKRLRSRRRREEEEEEEEQQMIVKDVAQLRIDPDFMFSGAGVPSLLSPTLRSPPLLFSPILSSFILYPLSPSFLLPSTCLFSSPSLQL